MLERQVLVPVDAECLWRALTEEQKVSSWFGASVRWDLRPGGAARFVEESGVVRHGIIEEVRTNGFLRFRWWEEGDNRTRTSEVSYELEPVEGGTQLRITEAPVRTASAGPAQASASSAWSAWDSRLVGMCADLALTCASVA